MITATQEEGAYSGDRRAPLAAVVCEGNCANWRSYSAALAQELPAEDDGISRGKPNMDHDETQFPRRTWPEPQGPIDLNDAESIAGWCSKLQTSEQQLRKAISSVGPMPAAVDYFLNGRKLK